MSEVFAKGLESILLGLVGLVLAGLCRGELGVSWLGLPLSLDFLLSCWLGGGGGGASSIFLETGKTPRYDIIMYRYDTL